jgi:hypothetical protein
MDKESVFRHEMAEPELDLAASSGSPYRTQRKSTISMIFTDSLNTLIGSAEDAGGFGTACDG